MKNFLLLLCIVFSINLSAQVTRDEAINIVIDELIYPHSLEYKWLFSKYDILLQNDTVWTEFEAYYLCPFDENWVFFIDDNPGAYWAHDCRYVFMDVSNGNYDVIDELWPPILFWNFSEFLEEWEWIQSVNVNENELQEPADFFIVNPNPFQNQLGISTNSDINESIFIQLFDSMGRLVLSVINKKPLKNESLVKLNTVNLESGVYILIISNENQILANEKLVKIN